MILGLDISTSITGYTLIKEDNVKTIRVLNLPNNRVSAKDTDRMYKII